ncbi:LEAF RUST 10 DISEASE-RESISTANCE LOCUS RECEPTOR-LIKE PROTEIN KINASE-like 2.7 [Fagus crenata]
MDAHLPLSSLVTLSFFFFFTILPPSYCIEDELFVQCGQTYNCGDIKNISFPFWGDDRSEYCGLPGFQLECHDGKYPTIRFEELEFRVLHINTWLHTMTIARLDLLNIATCPQKLLNTTLDFNIFDYVPATDQNLTLFYDCSPRVDIPVQNSFNCSLEVGVTYNAYFVDESLWSIQEELIVECKRNFKVPILRSAPINESEGGVPALQKVLNRGFDVEYLRDLSLICSACVESGGECGSNFTHRFACYCRDGVQSHVCLIRGTHILCSSHFPELG